MWLTTMLYWFSCGQSFPLTGPGLCDYILPLAFSLPSFPLPTSLLSSAQYPWRVLYRNDISVESLIFIMVSNLHGSNNFMVQNEQGQQTLLKFSCHALTSQMIAKLTFIFSQH